MPLDTTLGGATTDSHASLADASTYILARYPGEWTESDAEKEGALRRATAFIDGRYRANLPGVRVGGRAQSLEWPRQGAVDASGQAISSTEIPVEIFRAVCEAARIEIKSPGALAPSGVKTAAQAAGIERVLTKVGDLEWEAVKTGGSDTTATTTDRPDVYVIEDILSSLFSTVTADEKTGGGTFFLDRA